MSGRKGFAVEGRKTPIWSKPGNLSNTELTIKLSKKSSEEKATTSRGRRHAQRPLATATLTDLGGTLSSSVGNSEMAGTRKSVTFDSAALREQLNSRELERGLDSSIVGSHELNDSGVGPLNGALHTSTYDEMPWFTRCSHHVSRESHDGTINKTPLGTVGVALSSMLSLDDQMEAGAHGTLASLSKEFFPLTLSASTFAKSIDVPMQTNLVTPRATSQGLPHPGTAPWKPKRSKSPTRKHNANSASTSTPSGLASERLEKMYLRTVEAPVTASAPGAMAVTPFQAELARLRMERLKLEEKHLLEIKRQEELERIRGPQPKWYELKSPDFHYEAHKNTELLKSEAEWQAMLDYRTKLLTASKDLRSTHTAY